MVKKEGTGTELPMTGDKVFVHYVGTLLDGTQFDSSRDRGEKFSFELGKGGFGESEVDWMFIYPLSDIQTGCWHCDLCGNNTCYDELK